MTQHYRKPLLCVGVAVIVAVAAGSVWLVVWPAWRISRLIRELAKDDWAKASAELESHCPRAVPYLLKALEDPDPQVRGRAALTLHESDAARHLLHSEISRVVRSLGDDDWQVRMWAAGLLGQLGQDGRDAVPALTLATNDKEPYVRQFAAYALWRITQRPELAAPVTIQGLASEDSNLWVNATILLGARMGGSALPFLIEALSHGDARVRRGAAAALRRFHNPQEAKPAIPGLSALLNDSDEKVRRTAAQALSAICSDEVSFESDPWNQ
jgi:HEAT repeat protein